MKTEVKTDFKPVVIGKDCLPTEMATHLHSSNMLGINVYTDSEEMQRCIQLSGASPGIDTNDQSVNFYYLTQTQLPFKTASGAPLRQLEKDYPGDIYMSPDMRNFYFWGIDKLGTLVSMIYGIRTISGLEENRLGLHSALIYDTEKNIAHLLIGEKRIGKSALGQTIENTNNRFVLISDDWNEINIEDLTIDPVSSVFSPDQLNNFYQEAFESFGKRFYWKHGVRPYPQLRLGSIIELHSNESSLNDGQFLERSMSHVPLLAQPLSDRDFDNLTNFSSSDLERYQMFQQQYHQAYENLISRVDRHQVINCKDNNSLKDITSQIMLIISL